jgi:hypothetical protein
MERHFDTIRALCCAAALIAAMTGAHAGEPPPAAIREAPAMQGHAAESKLRDAQEEAAHRRLFFDDALAEAGLPGVSCDHRVESRPETSLGIGSVHIVWRPADGRVVARLWQAPDMRLAPAEAAARLDLMVAAALGRSGDAALKIAERSFAWCR